MPTRGVVVDRFGNEVDDDDSDVVADGHGLRVPVRFMDSQQRMVAAATGHAVEDADDADDADDTTLTWLTTSSWSTARTHMRRAVTGFPPACTGTAFRRRCPTTIWPTVTILIGGRRPTMP